MITEDTLITEMEAPTRLVNSLLNSYPRYKRATAKVGDFINKSEDELLRLDNFGRKTLAEWQTLTRHLRGYDTETARELDDADHELRAMRKMRATLNTISGLHLNLARLYRELGDIVLPNGPKKGG